MENQLGQQILSESLRLFLEKGYESVKVSEICEACSITKPTFYRFAHSKGSLIEKYYSGILDNMLQLWEQSQHTHGYWSSIVRAFGYLLVRISENGPDLVQQLFIHDLESGRDLFMNSARLFGKLNDYISQAQKAGDIGNTRDSREITRTMLNLLTGYLCKWILNDGKTDLISDYLVAIETLCMPKEWDEVQ